MPVFKLPKELIFPDPSYAEPDGMLALGGDLKPERLLLAYSNGIFPWYSEKPILWWSPDPRCILYPQKFNITKSLQQTLKKKIFTVRFDTCFEKVITHCANVKRPGEEGTWITKEMIKAYCKLHELGFAHSIETFKEGELVGGLYGISLGGAFFGESMFHLVTDASKVAFYYLVQFCKQNNFDFIDNQVTTGHLVSLGAQEIPRSTFLDLLTDTLKKETLKGNWSNYLQ